MTLKTSFSVGLAVAALVVGVQTASAAPTSDGSHRTNLVQPDLQYPGGYPQSGHGYLSPVTASTLDLGQNLPYPGGYPQSGHGYLSPVTASTVDSGSDIDWPKQLGIGFGVGMVVLLGLFLTVRIGRSHPLAH